MDHPDIVITRILSSPFEENSYIAHIKGASECIVIDPGLEPEKIVRSLESDNLTPTAILNTHGHSDHIAGNAALKTRWPDAELVIGKDEAAKLTDPNQNLSAAFGLPLVSPAADVLVDDQQSYASAGLTLQVRSIPGHSSGHVVFLLDGQQPMHVFVGDVIFAGSVGRTDFPDGDFEQLKSGIHQKLFTLDDDAILLPGHGPATTVGEEKRNNPFVALR